MALIADNPEVLVASDDDLREAVTVALGRLDMTFEELAADAANGQFRSELARMTWVAIKDIGSAVS